jgi:4-hydroxy-2-oxoheptanedioate aldolase
MKINTAKQRMLAGEPAIGAGVGLGSTLACELLSLVGFDFLLVDNQHGAWDDTLTMAAFRNINLGSAIPMARVRQNEFGAIGRLLDVGALGIVVPMVHTVEDAQRAVHATRFPPLGGRSLGPFGVTFYGPDYHCWIDEQVFLAIQLESQRAVEHAEEILSVEGIDGCWVGPADLALSMGVDPSTPDGFRAHEAALLSVVEACQKAGKVPGIASTEAEVARRVGQGFLFVTAGGDRTYMLSGAESILRDLGRIV